jgi:fatty acid desaturase
MENSPPAESFEGDPVSDWYFPKLSRIELRKLSQRSNLHGLTHVGLWLFLCVCSGIWVVESWGSWMLLPAVTVYGVLLSFSYAASHECSHGTAFRTRWLNEAIFWITSVIFMEEALYRRYAHADHHTYTWFNASDPQKPYGNPMTWRQYLQETLLLTFYADAFTRLSRHALGRFSAQESGFLPQAERRRVRFDSLLMLLIYVGLLLWGLLVPSPWPFVLYFIPRYIGGCVVNLYINTQHMCMGEDIRDHRQTTRSIRCNRAERMLYWNMNYHIEHHLYPSVPFHALARLSASIAHDLPEPAAGVLKTNLLIVRTIRRQKRAPGFHLS